MSMWCALWATLSLAWAEPLRVGWDDVLRLLDGSPAVAADQARVAEAEGAQRSAHGLPNPWFEYKGFYHARGTDLVDGRQEEFQLFQPIPVMGQRAARIRQAKRSLAAAGSGYEAALNERSQEVGHAFVDLLAAQERVGWLEETGERLQRIEQIVDRQIEAGVRSPYDRMRVRVEVAGVRAELGDALADRVDAAGRLAGLLGLEGRVPEADGPLPLPLRVDGELEGATAPVLRAALEEAEAARAGVQIARRDMIPQPAVGAGWFLVDGWTSQSAILALNMDLPLLSPGIGRLRTAKAEAQGAERRAEAIRRALAAEQRRALGSLEVREEALERFEADVVAQLPDLQRMGEQAYLEAAADLLDLLDGIRTAQSQRLLHVELRSDVARAQLDALAAVGALGRR